MTLLKQFIKPQWLCKGVMSIHLVHGGFKSSRWRNSSAVVYFFTTKSRKYLLSVIGRKVVFWFFTSLEYIVIL